MKYKNYLGCLVLTIIGAANAAMALDCTQRPTCEELGYTSTPDECVGGKMAKCPWDYNAVFCMEKSKFNADLSVNCEVGDILYSDLKCYSVPAQGGVAIGVVFDTENRLAVALDSERSRWTEAEYADTDISALENCTSTNALSSCGTDGKANTKAMLDQFGYSPYSAATYCYNYITEGTEKGDWYLPSAKELMKLVSSKNTISSSLASVGGTFYDSMHWSSTEYGANSAWSMQTDYYWGNNKATTQYVKCVIGY